jgi:tripartite-type tricarboxylate transporter receptor subunit TctC
MTAAAQQYPERPVRVVVSYSAGATNDIVARAVAQRLTVAFKQNFFVENKVGGNGTIGTGFVAREPADGYNLLLGNTSTLAIHPSLFSSLPYDPTKDFQAVSILAESPTVLVVNAALPVRTVKELVAYSKANAKSVAYGSPGTGTPFHLSGELFNSQTGTTMLHVPYKGVAPALTDLIGGHTQMVMTSLPSAMNHVQSGRLKALAVGSEQRSSFMPNLPTISEAGVSGYMAEFWWGIAVPAKTPIEIVNRLGSELSKAMQSPDLKQKFAAEGAEPSNMGREPFTQFVRNEITRWRKVAQETGIKPE